MMEQGSLLDVLMVPVPVEPSEIIVTLWPGPGDTILARYNLPRLNGLVFPSWMAAMAAVCVPQNAGIGIRVRP